MLRDTLVGDISNAPLVYLTAPRFNVLLPRLIFYLPQPLNVPLFLAPQGRNGMHSDSYAMGTYPYADLLGKTPSVTTKSFGGVGGE